MLDVILLKYMFFFFTLQKENKLFSLKKTCLKRNLYKFLFERLFLSKILVKQNGIFLEKRIISDYGNRFFIPYKISCRSLNLQFLFKKLDPKFFKFFNYNSLIISYKKGFKTYSNSNQVSFYTSVNFPELIINLITRHLKKHRINRYVSKRESEFFETIRYHLINQFSYNGFFPFREYLSVNNFLLKYNLCFL
mmetsp:Transcript_32051/g.44694  ORF Transcript_32051/g.44694 Transcript_32051/m.44694 type:complete len:193 (-) Transcript_32051:2017-2595(-)